MYRVSFYLQIPKTAIYIPNFVSSLEEKELIQKVYSAPKPKWTQLKNRRLQNWGGIPHPKGMIPEKIPEVCVQNDELSSSKCLVLATEKTSSLFVPLFNFKSPFAFNYSEIDRA